MNINDLNASVNTKEIVVFGERITVNKEDKIIEKLQEILQRKGVEAFTLYIDGQEINSLSDIPERFSDVETLEVVRQVKAG